MTSIAAVVLCLNEYSQLTRCIKSLKWCDEIYLVDSGSSDGSKELAERLGAKVFVKTRRDRFIITEQRNWALSHLPINSKWVLFLDADEEIKTPCKESIMNSLVKYSYYSGFEMAPRFWFLGRWLKRTQGYPNWHPRIVRLGANSFSGGVWESFTHLENVGKIQEPYEHYAFSKGTDDWISRHMRYSSWDANSIIQYNKTQDQSTFSTTRKLRLRILSAKAWPLKPLARFIRLYIFNGGWIEGWQSLLFSLLISSYELFTITKIIEHTRKEKGLDL